MRCGCGEEVDDILYAAALALKEKVEQRPWPEGTQITLYHWHIQSVVSVGVILPSGKWWEWDNEEEFIAWSRSDKQRPGRS